MRNHKVKQGETLSKIAKEYGVSVSQIQRANASLIKDINEIKSGWVLAIPNSCTVDDIRKAYNEALEEMGQRPALRKLFEMLEGM